MNILIIEDDKLILDYVASGLAESGHSVETADEGTTGLARALAGNFDAMVIDRMLPGVDGLSILKAVRAAKINTPVLFLTAIGGVADRVEGLEAGADDYLVKPFAYAELQARLSAIARRLSMLTEKTEFQLADLKMDLVARAVERGGMAIDLLPKEFVLLEYFLRNSGKTLSKNMLLERVWDFHFNPQTSVVETHISRLRAKIDRPFDKPLLHTIKNIGYCLREAE